MPDRRTVLTAGLTGVAGALLLGGEPATAAPRVVRTLARDLRVPWGLAFLPRGDALVTERVTGRVHLVRRTGGRAQVGAFDVSAVGEGGLLGVALHPGFRDNRWVYFYLTRGDENGVVRRRLRSDLTLGPTQRVYDGIPAGSTHNGGRIRFGPDGMLYVGTGDAGNRSLAQNRRSAAGKILRMTPTGGVPDGNPFGNRVWSYGHRNVQGLDWDGQRRLWATELGQDRRDELNRVLRGRNYGWPRVEGGDGSGGYVDPFVTWAPSSCSPSGLAVVGGRAYVGALRGRALWVVTLTGSRARRKVRYLSGTLGRIRTVEPAPDGSLWVTTSNRDGRGSASGTDERVVRLRL
jgi:glucose/arabinose dehydrogenase